MESNETRKKMQLAKTQVESKIAWAHQEGKGIGAAGG